MIQHGLRAAALLALAGTLGGCATSRCGAETVVVLVRHADRVESTDDLTPAGRARARELAHALEKAGVTAVVTSDAARATQTAAPFAAAAGLTPIALPGADIAAFVREIGRQRGGTVLVVGHSNTVPRIVAGLGGPQLPDIAGAEFDDLQVLTLRECAAARLVRLQYGARSPHGELK